MKKVLIASFAVAAFLSTPSMAQADGEASEKSAPKTKLEAFQAQTGSVVIKGFTSVGEVSGTGRLEVKAMEFVDAKTGRKQSGIVMDVTESGRLERTNSSFIDIEEVDSLLKGIDYVSKAGKEVTKLSSFEATYKTKGDFEVATFSSGSRINAVVSSGGFRPCRAFIDLAALPKLYALIEDARTKLTP